MEQGRAAALKLQCQAGSAALADERAALEQDRLRLQVSYQRALYPVYVPICACRQCQLTAPHVRQDLNLLLCLKTCNQAA